MKSDSLTDLMVHRVNNEMPQIQAQLKDLRSHVTVLADIGSRSKSIDARNLMSSANTAKGEAVQLKHKLASLADAAHSVSRRRLGDAYGTFMGNYKGNLRNINKEILELEQAISRLDAVASANVNDPGRWGDAAADTAVAQLFGILNSLLEFWAHLRVKEKLNS